MKLKRMNLTEAYRLRRGQMCTLTGGTGQTSGGTTGGDGGSSGDPDPAPPIFYEGSNSTQKIYKAT
jgi:hypothetical protein